MAASERPGGLTALAVISILYGVMSLFAPVGLWTMKNMQFDEGTIQDPAAEATIRAHQELSNGTLTLISVLAVGQGLLYIVSAVGFLRMKKFLGYVLGNLGALTAVAVVFVNMFLLPEQVDQGRFTLSTISQLLYPSLCLYLLNFVFRADLNQ